jgi:ribose transport system substrate-binding protein
VKIMIKSFPVVVALGIVCTLGLSACSDGSSGTPDAKKAPQIAVISPYLSQQPTTREVVDDFSAAAKAKGYTVTTVDTASDFAKMNTEIQQAASRKVSAIVLGQGDPKQMGPGLRAAKAAGVPVIGIDAGEADGIAVNVTSDNTFLGRTSAQAMVDAIGGQGSVLMFTFDPFEPVRLRGQEARKYFESKGIKVIDYVQIDAPNGLADSKTKAKDALAKYPKGAINGIWCAWDQSANGAYQAVQAAGRSDVKITGVDGQQFAIAAIDKGGPWVATVKQDWPTIATTAADQISIILGGGKPQSTSILVPGTVYPKTAG